MSLAQRLTARSLRTSALHQVQRAFSGTATTRDPNDSSHEGTATSSPPPPCDQKPFMSVTVRRPQDKGTPKAASAIDTRYPVTGSGTSVKRILLIRNGQSDAVTDPSVIVNTPDWRIPLTESGYQETVNSGRQLAKLLHREPVYIYFSPFLRTKQSLSALLEGALEVRRLNIAGIREDVRLRDGDIGRYESVTHYLAALEEQKSYGSFFYRFPHGESGADVCDRVSSFLDVFQREKLTFPPNTNVLIATHDLTIRMFIKRWFHLTVDTFEKMKSVPTAGCVELLRTDHDPFKFKLSEESRELLGLPPSLRDEEGYTNRNSQLLGSLSTGAPFL